MLAVICCVCGVLCGGWAGILGGGAVLPREGRWLAAVLACGPAAVLSHVSAAVHWGLLNYEPARPEVTAPASRKGVPGIRLHRSVSLDAQDTTDHQGIPTTTVHRTLLDIAAHVPGHHLERALAQAERLQLYDHRAITETIARANGHRGTKRLTEATQSDPQFTRGDLEALMNQLARDHGLPQPQSNRRPRRPRPPRSGGRLLLPRLPLRHRDRRLGHPPHPALTAAGYTVVRFTYRELRDDPDTVADRIKAILRPRGLVSPRRARGGPARA